jgi:hypothetical protein
MQNPFISIALVGYLTNDVMEYVNRLNIDDRVYKPLYINNELGADFKSEFHSYMLRDQTLRVSTKMLLDTYSDNFGAIANALEGDNSAIEELYRSYNNFYLDYIESIKFIALGSLMLVPYPLASNRNMEFDYYIVLEQDYDKIFVEHGKNEPFKILFQMYKRRMDEVLPYIPQDKMVKITLPYKPYNESDTETITAFVDQIGSACNTFFEDNYKKLLSFEIDSNPQSSNSTS